MNGIRIPLVNVTKSEEILNGKLHFCAVVQIMGNFSMFGHLHLRGLVFSELF